MVHCTGPSGAEQHVQWNGVGEQDERWTDIIRGWGDDDYGNDIIRGAGGDNALLFGDALRPFQRCR